MITSKVFNRALYIHIPFCKSKCYYCDFNSYSSKEQFFKPYITALKQEMSSTSKLMQDSYIKTIFIGGGTPSILPPGAVSEIMSDCRHFYNIDQAAEITIETNPGTLTINKLEEYKICGINRLSIGLQAWQNELLKMIGRIHRLEDFLKSFELAKKVGFTNINTDLIFSLPSQTLNDWKQTVDEISKLDLPHISCYSLIIEEGTVFGDRLKKNEIEYVDDELDRNMYWYAVYKLGKAGFKHYEISNFAKPGYECKHNMIYWKAEEYLGIGAGAYSYIDGKRYGNVMGVEEYIKLQDTLEVSILSTSYTSEQVEQSKYADYKKHENFEIVDEFESMQEYIMLGLRLIEGVSFKDFEHRFDKEIMELYGDKVNELLKKRLIEIQNGYLKLTKYGLDTANQVFCEFV